ncbi:MAG: GntR family transcriptional regulator [Clostridiales bacterium]|nr:GntR family transcriptional regulator [Clostridiales bacterium]
MSTSIKGAKNEQIYDILKKDILRLTIPPGEKISETILSEKYGVSRSPIRDALRRLKQDRLVIIEPQVGTFVAEISPFDLLEIFRIKIANDPLAAKFAAERINPKDLVPIREKFEKVKMLDIDKRYQLQKEFDDQLHMFIFNHCGEYLGRICKDLFYYSERIRLYTTKCTNTRLQGSLQEAEKILIALENKDPEEAYRLSKEHLENLYAVLCNTLGVNV